VEKIKPKSLEDYLTSVDVLLRGITVKHYPGNVPKNVLMIQFGRSYTPAHDITSIFVDHPVIKKFELKENFYEASQGVLKEGDKLRVYFYPVDEVNESLRLLRAECESNIYRKHQILNEIEGYELRAFKEVETPVKIEKIENNEPILVYPLT
jgi:hypothetical protein